MALDKQKAYDTDEVSNNIAKIAERKLKQRG